MSDNPMQLTAYEAKCVRIALVFGDPAIADLPDDDLERAKAKLRAIEAVESFHGTGRP